MNVSSMSTKEVGDYGERAAKAYFIQQGFIFVDKNISRKTGEIDLIMSKWNTLHFIEVKTVMCPDFNIGEDQNVYNPAENLHLLKIRKVQKTSQWYMAERHWEGDAQIDGAFVWVRRRDGVAKIRYIPQIL